MVRNSRLPLRGVVAFQWNPKR